MQDFPLHGVYIDRNINNKQYRNENNETLENRFCDACCFLHRLVPLRHSPTVVTHPQGRHVFGEIIPNIHKTPEHLFRLSPRQTLFRSLYERFRWTIFRSALPLATARTLPNEQRKKLFPMSPFALLNCYIDESVQENRSLTI